MVAKVKYMHMIYKILLSHIAVLQTLFIVVYLVNCTWSIFCLKFSKSLTSAKRWLLKDLATKCRFLICFKGPSALIFVFIASGHQRYSLLISDKNRNMFYKRVSFGGKAHTKELNNVKWTSFLG